MAESSGVSIFVLVVDDDELMRELLSALLEAAGHRVRTVESSQQAVTLLRQQTGAFDAVLTDLRMPGSTAVGLLTALRKAIGPEMRLIGMSGSPADAAELELVDGFLLKPFSVDEFASIVERARAGGQQASPVFTQTPVRDAPVLDEAVYARMAKSLPPTALRQMYELTLDDVAQRTESIRKAAEESDGATMKSEAHAMKGGCGMVGAMELRTIAADIEAGSPVDTPVLEEIAAARERLRRMLDTLT